MKRCVSGIVVAAVLTVARCCQAADVYPTAILNFQERGSDVEGSGSKVSDVLFALLAANPDLHLVDRTDLNATFKEQELNLSGAVEADQAIRIGRLSGARLLITGSVVELDRSIYLVAKVIGTETGKVVGVSVKGATSDELAPLVEQLAEKVNAAIEERSGQLVAGKEKRDDRLAALKQKLRDAEKKPKLWIKVTERHIGRETIDPAAETELIVYAKGAGFDVVDHKEGSRKQADVIIEGEAFSELATRNGNLIGVQARVEIKAVDRVTGRVLASDRQTEIVIDLAEQVAGKTALQNGGAAIAERLLPKLVATDEESD